MPTETVDTLLEQLKALRIQESKVLDKIHQARAQEKQTHQGPNNNEAPAYEYGDRVRIQNAISKPFTRHANTGNQDSTVQYTLTNNNITKVFIQTDNGFNTWRLEKNLRRITHKETQQTK
jgi:carboxylesterase type B